MPIDERRMTERKANGNDAAQWECFVYPPDICVICTLIKVITTIITIITFITIILFSISLMLNHYCQHLNHYKHDDNHHNRHKLVIIAITIIMIMMIAITIIMHMSWWHLWSPSLWLWLDDDCHYQRYDYDLMMIVIITMIISWFFTFPLVSCGSSGKTPCNLAGCHRWHQT